MKEILKEILNHYGKDQQLLVVYEELSELTKSITKYERGLTKQTNNIIEETAHVLIVLEYVKMIYEFDDNDVKKEIDKKLKKLKNYKELYPKT